VRHAQQCVVQRARLFLAKRANYVKIIACPPTWWVVGRTRGCMKSASDKVALRVGGTAVGRLYNSNVLKVCGRSVESGHSCKRATLEKLDDQAASIGEDSQSHLYLSTEQMNRGLLEVVVIHRSSAVCGDQSVPSAPPFA
jgi:hypothetical protein